MVVDIAICGAGAAGCALTIALARAGYSILVLEREVIPTPRPGESLPPYRRNVNTVFQSYALFPHLTVRGNIEFGLRRKRADRIEERLRAVLEPVSYTHLTLPTILLV